MFLLRPSMKTTHDIAHFFVFSYDYTCDENKKVYYCVTIYAMKPQYQRNYLITYVKLKVTDGPKEDKPIKNLNEKSTIIEQVYLIN